MITVPFPKEFVVVFSTSACLNVGKIETMLENVKTRHKYLLDLSVREDSGLSSADLRKKRAIRRGHGNAVTQQPTT